MKHYDSLIIGHITKDFNIDHLNNLNEICGGAVLFSLASAFVLGHSTGAVTSRYKGNFQRQRAKSVGGKNQRNRNGDCRQAG